MNDDINEIYSEELLSYAEKRPPKAVAENRPPDLVVEGGNPHCGDRAELKVWLKDNKVSSVSWTTTGCVVSQAGAARCAELITGRSMEEVVDFSLADFQSAFGEKISMRYRCALLCLWLVQQGIRFKKQQPENSEWRNISTDVPLGS